MSASLNLYDRSNIDLCIWPKNSDGEYAQKYLIPLIKNGSSRYVENVTTDMQLLVIDELVLPITINDTEYNNSIVCSPYSYYISFAQDSLPHLSQSWLNPIIKPILAVSGKILQKQQFNKNVIVNNWLFSTSLYPKITSHQLTEILHFLQKRFPEHAIIFRSIDPLTNPGCYPVLDQLGFDYIATRQMYFIDPQKSQLFDSRLFKSDIKLLKNCEYEVIGDKQLTENDYPRLLELYQQLSLEKYSRHNPNLTETFIHLLITQNLMHFKALRKNGNIDGVVGFIQRHGLMMCPFIGYDRKVPQETALYRLLSTILMLEAHSKDLQFHLCSGASFFKKIRKAQACIEYMAVYSKHLKYSRQILWRTLKTMCNSIGISVMKKY